MNFNGLSPYHDNPTSDFREKTVAVKSLPANPWGLYEMHGNVREWCEDRYGEYPAAPVTDPAGPDDGSSRVLRGGSWSGIGRICRSAFRVRLQPEFVYFYPGFRLARGQ